MFGVSRAVQRCWTKQGWQAAALDIKIGGSSHDILTKRGFLNFLDHIMMMLLGSVEHFLLLYVLFFSHTFHKTWSIWSPDKNVVRLGYPPCSLFVWISRGTHLRSSSHFDVFGNMALPSVRMSNAILRNFAAQMRSQFCMFFWCELSLWIKWIHGIDVKIFKNDARMFAGNIFLAEAYLVEVSHRVRPIFWIIEQPMSSQMFDMPTMRSCAALWGLFMVTTWMGCYGHLLQKNTKLLCNLPGSKACFINNYCIIFWFFCFILHPFRTVASMMKLTLASEL